MNGPVGAPPAALAAWLSSPASSRHLGHSPCAASADSSAPHLGHRGLSVIRGFLISPSPSSKENAGPGYSAFLDFRQISTECCPEVANLVVHFLLPGHRFGDLCPQDLSIPPA